MERTKVFIAQELELEIFNAKAIIDQAFRFIFDDEDETIYNFPDYSSAFIQVYDERYGQLIKTITGLSRTSNTLILNASVSDMTFDDLGNYFYIMGYVRSGGYEIPLRFGKFIVR